MFFSALWKGPLPSGSLPLSLVEADVGVCRLFCVFMTVNLTCESLPFKPSLFLPRSPVDLRAVEAMFTRHPCVLATVWLLLSFEPHFICCGFPNCYWGSLEDTCEHVAGLTLRRFDIFWLPLPMFADAQCDSLSCWGSHNDVFVALSLLLM